MSHHNDTDASTDACGCEPYFYSGSQSSLMKDPWACYEDDANACGSEVVEEAQDDCCCCC
jgi:hypothetical protein